MEKKLFVGNLSWKVREPELRRWLDDNGIVCEKVEVVLERDTDRLRGFGFLHFESEAAALEAQTRLNNVELDGREVHVEVAAPSPNRSGRGGGSASSGRGDHRRDGDRRRDDDRSVDRRGRSVREW